MNIITAIYSELIELYIHILCVESICKLIPYWFHKRTRQGKLVTFTSTYIYTICASINFECSIDWWRGVFHSTLCQSLLKRCALCNVMSITVDEACSIQRYVNHCWRGVLNTTLCQLLLTKRALYNAMSITVDKVCSMQRYANHCWQDVLYSTQSLLMWCALFNVMSNSVDEVCSIQRYVSYC